MKREILKARLKRWWYLVSGAMYRGECCIDLTDANTGELLMLASGREATQPENWRIWWRR